MITVRIFPSLAMQAIRQNSGGAYRLWEFARNIDKAGSGAIREADLRSLCMGLGVNGGTYQRWLQQSIALGMLRWVDTDCLVILGLYKTCLTLDCKRLDTRRVEMPIDCLIGPGWRAYIWAAYEVEFRGKPISRIKQYELTGKHPNTQRKWDNHANVTRTKNYAISKKDASCLSMEIELGKHAAPFVRDGHVCYRLPDIRTSDTVLLIGRGMSRHVNQALSGLIEKHEAGHKKLIRLFNYDEKELHTTEKKLAKNQGRNPDEIYFLHKTTKGATLWIQC